MPDDLVTTPGGPRSRSLVHLIEDGTVLDGTNGRLRKLSGAGKVLTDFGVLRRRPAGVPLHPGNVTLPRTEVTPAFGSGWITYAWWSNATGTPVSSFATTWTVPEPPSTQSGQLIYLFSGIQNSTMIYQPVLQWGSNGAFGGNYWCVASWYVDGQGGPGFHSSPVPVNPGDTLVGVMALTGQSGSQFSYNCGFQGSRTRACRSATSTSSRGSSRRSSATASLNTPMLRSPRCRTSASSTGARTRQ